jgi:hypothetical protein
MKSKVQSEIAQATVARGVDKQTHEVFYVVKSDSQANTWYEVRWSNQRLAWECGCPATKPCKHERAINQVLAVRRATIALAMGGDVPAIVARMQSEEDEALRFNPWHGSNRDGDSTRETLPLNGNRPVVRERGIPMR